MKISIPEFISAKTGHKKINENQRDNISKILKISNNFNTDAEIVKRKNMENITDTIDNDIIILESGHQPNYLPYPGVFKKAFLLSIINKQLSEKNKNSIAFFGFADQNLTTSSNLYKNIIPAINKNGTEKIGFNIKGKDKWKCFEQIPKPPLKLWEAEINRIKQVYSKNNYDNCREITEIMWKSYENAKNFPDLNAFIFSRICTDIFNLNIFFFRYSDIQKDRIFLNETKNLLNYLSVHNNTYNSVIKRDKLNIREIKSGEIPLWYHCNCGGKVPVEQINKTTCSGVCPVCERRYNLSIKSDFEGIDSYYRNMSFSAVARNLIFSEGLGTSIFISGSGGGLRYGRIADEIAPLISFNSPATLAWMSGDYYIGNIQKLAIKNLKKSYNIDEKDLLSPEPDSVLLNRQNELLKEIVNEDLNNNQNLKATKGKLLNLRLTAQITSKLFSSTPSFLDLFMNINPEEISQRWEHAIITGCAEQFFKAHLLKHNITYGKNSGGGIDPEMLPQLYSCLKNIPVIEIDKEHSCYQSAHR